MSSRRRTVYAVCKGAAVKTETGQRFNTICARNTREDAQSLADCFEQANLYVVFLEYLSALVVDSGDAGAVRAQDNAEQYARFAEKYNVNDRRRRLYNVMELHIEEEEEEAAPRSDEH